MLGIAISLAHYANAELADMHWAFEAADCSGPAKQKMYVKRYPTRRIFSHNFFGRLYLRLAEICSMQRSGRERVRTATIPAIEQNVL